jgi:hypothetical protein
MDFLGLFRRETDEEELSGPARMVLGMVRNGLSAEEAAGKANVPAEDLRKWMREPAFRMALRRKVGVPHIWVDTPSARGEIPPPSASEHEIEQAGFRRVK